MRHRWIRALPLGLLLAATVAVVASVPLHRTPRLVWSTDQGDGTVGEPHVAPDAGRIPAPSFTSCQSPGGLTGFTVLPFPNRIVRRIGLRLMSTTIDDDDWFDCTPTGREVLRASGRWREYKATPSW